MAYNLAYDPENISESGEVVEPVTLAEIKKALRIDEYSISDGMTVQDPLELTLAEGQTSVQSNNLIGGSIISLSRSGTNYSKAETAGNLTYAVNTTTGTVSFLNQGNAGGEPVIIVYSDSQGVTYGSFTFDDDLLNEMIVSAREWVEVRTDMSLVPKTLRAVIDNPNGKTQLRGGPVNSDITLTDCDGGDLTAEITGNRKFPLLNYPRDCNMVATYEAGYTADDIPKGLKQAIIAHVVESYENRGDEMTNDRMYRRAANLCSSFSKGKMYG